MKTGRASRSLSGLPDEGVLNLLCAPYALTDLPAYGKSFHRRAFIFNVQGIPVFMYLPIQVVRTLLSFTKCIRGTSLVTLLNLVHRRYEIDLACDYHTRAQVRFARLLKGTTFITHDF